MADLLLDTDILIDVSRGVREAITFLALQEQISAVGISTVTQLEMLIGCRNKTEQDQVDDFLARFEIVRLSEAIADRAAELIRQYRLSHGLLLADSLIASTALSLTLPLATKNQRDYRFIQGLQLLGYP